jgi:hypothetical protein
MNEAFDVDGNRMTESGSSMFLPFDEGEAPRALLVEGATLAPIIDPVK